MIAQGTRVLLRDQPRPSDAEDVFRWLNLAEWQYYDEPDAPFTPITRAAFDARRQTAAPRSTNRRWQIDTLDGRHIGWLSAYQWDDALHSAFIGICTWNQGYGADAVRLLVDYLHCEMSLREIRLATWSGNHRMMRCALKCGFREIARLPHRASVSVRGEPLERVEFAIVVGDPAG